MAALNLDINEIQNALNLPLPDASALEDNDLQEELEQEEALFISEELEIDRQNLEINALTDTVYQASQDALAPRSLVDYKRSASSRSFR
jgi:hypothetical protein